jgi:1,4-alpha-glucan branching enzyme
MATLSRARPACRRRAGPGCGPSCPAPSRCAVAADGASELTRRHPEGIFEAEHDPPGPYRLRVRWPDGSSSEFDDPYRFGPVLGEMDAGCWPKARTCARSRSWARTLRRVEGVDGTVRSPSGPRTPAVSAWSATSTSGTAAATRCGCAASAACGRSSCPASAPARYKYELLDRDGNLLPLKADPYAFAAELRPADRQRGGTTAPVVPPSSERRAANALDAPISIYEVHLASAGAASPNRQPLADWDELAETLVPYAPGHGLHPPRAAADQRAPLRRLLGLPDAGPVRAHRAPRRQLGACAASSTARMRPAWACCSTGCRRTSRPMPMAWPRFDGSCLYEYADPREGFPPGLEHPDLQLRPHRSAQLPGRQRAVLDRALRRRRPARRRRRLHALPRLQPQGRRMDPQRARRAREPGGHRLPQALNEVLGGECPQAITLAEESTAFPAVSRPTWAGGLGFHYKWNMGWMHDTLKYLRATRSTGPTRAS